MLQDLYTEPGWLPPERRQISTADLLNRIAATDATFRRRGECWIGKCLICGGPLRFDADTGEGATIEHILPRSLGGTNDLLNLGIAHRRCNGEKGRRWDPKRRHSAMPERYRTLLERLHAERLRRWRTPVHTEEQLAHDA
jgi:5-methylcytosine-specific restriction endonuclease McrA